jgi:hypothetical protein
VPERNASVLRKLTAAAIALVVVFVALQPLVRELLDLFGTDADRTDSVVRTVMEWVLVAVLVATVYTCIVEGPRAVARLWARRKGVSRR